MALSKRKQKLIDEMKERGFSDQEIDWHLKRSTIAHMQTVLDNDRAHETITRLASEAGKNRTN